MYNLKMAIVKSRNM